MGSDNVDIFKKVIFHIPDFRTILAAVIGLGVLYSSLTFLAFDLIGNRSFSLWAVPFIAFFVYIFPAVASGEAYYYVLPDYPRSWGYFLAMSNQLMLFIYSLVLTLSGSLVTTWNIIWLGLITIYLSNFFVLLLSVGTDQMKKVSLISLIQPLLILASFHFFLGRYMQIPLVLYLMNFGFLFVMGFILLIVLLMFDYLMGSNVSNFTITGMASALLQKRQEALDLGYPTRPDVQAFRLEKQDSALNVSIPWVHPGPLEGFGGGKVTTHMIDALNDEEDGFFFHVPSTHQADPADPRDTAKLVDAMEKPETTGKASKLHKKEFENATFYGRTFGDQKIVFMDVHRFDDYEMAVFKEIIDLENTTIIDMHNHNPHKGERPLMYYGTSMADKMRERMHEFIEELEGLEQHEYRAGYEVELNAPSLFSLIEEVDGQKTLLFGIEGNGSSRNLRELREEYQDQFDEVLLFSTDTHSSIHEMATEKQVEKPKVRKVIEKASQNISKASIGLSHGKAERMRLLQKDYSSLMTSINILLRLIPLTLAIFYVILVVWVL
ncbi:MAG: DUF2070 family protein [Candidatus Nanohalobium sp.]